MSMFSLVAEALAVKEKVQMKELEGDVIELLNDVLSLRNDYIEATQNHYVKLTSPLNSSSYITEFSKFLRSYQSISEDFRTAKPTPTFSQDQLDNLSITLEEIKENLDIVNQLAEIDQSLITAKDFRNNNKFLECAKMLCTSRSLMKKPACNDELRDIIKAMKKDWILLCEHLIYFLTNMWREFISFDDMPPSSGNNLRIVQVNVSLKEDKKFLEVIEAMKYVDLLKFKFRSFGLMLLENIFKPLVEHECVVRREEKRRDQVATLEIIIDKNSSSPIYAIILHNLRLVFEFLDSYVNYEVPENGKVLKLVGDLIAKKFCKLVFRMKSFNNKDIDIFTNDIHAVDEFKKYLSEIGFIKFDSASHDKFIPELFDYLRNCKVLEEARNIMHRKIFDTIEVKQIFPPKYQYYLDLFNKKEPLNEELFKRWESLPSHLNISKSTHELMDLVHKLLEDATHKNKFEAVRQFYTVRNILEMYSLLLPDECQESAKGSAHISAIIFNNCLHLCEWIIHLSSKYHTYFPRLKNEFVVTFAPEAINIRKVGEDVFHAYVENKTNELIGYINEAELETEEFFKQEEVMKQCLTTLEVLKSTWLNLLSYHIYLKTMGVLLNSMIKAILKKVMLVDKISPELAACINVMLQDMVKRLQMNFTEEELSTINYMQKLDSVKLVLEGNPAQIILQWKRGEGALAKSLTSLELNKLVRSVFEGEELSFILNKIQSC